jgi:hypothetical protein
MTRIKITMSLSLAFLILGFLLPGCKKSNSFTSSVSGTVNSTNFQSSYVGASYFTFPNGSSAFSLNGIASNKTSILAVTFAAPRYNVPISPDQPVSTITYVNGTGVQYSATTGLGNLVITVTSWDSSSLHITGTFSGSVININNYNDSLSVTNGQFNTIYTKTN